MARLAIMIELSHVTQRFGRVAALADVSARLERGQVVALIGASGAGKTTLLRLMAACLLPTEGAIRVDGVDTRSDSRAVRRKVGYLPERDAVYPEMRVLEYLSFRARLKGLSGRARHKKLRELMARCGLQGLEGALLGNLSKGETRRVLLADSLSGTPPVLLLDEPTLGLDPANADRIRSLIAGAGAEGVVVFSTHDWSEAQSLASRVAVLHRGRLAAFDPPAALTARAHAEDFRSAVMALMARGGAA